MAKTESAQHTNERQKLQVEPRYFARFYHVKKFGAAADFLFSRDFSTGSVVSAATPKRLGLLLPIGAMQAIEIEQGRSTIGTLQLRIIDVSGEVLRQLSAPALTVAEAMSAGAPGIGGFVLLSGGVGGLPSIGTLEVTTTGVVERIRYDQVDATGGRVRVSGRGVDGTTAAAHAVGDAAANGEQIRPGQRMQLFSGYAPLTEAQYMSWPKMEVVGRALEPDGITFVIAASDIQRTIRRTVFLTATDDAPVTLTGNLITLALQVLTSTGTGTNGIYDVLLANNGLSAPQALIDVTGLETLRDTEFVGQVYDFSITGPEDGKQFLEREFWQMSNCFPVITQAGKFSVKRIKQTGTAVAALTASEVIRFGWRLGDQQVINVVEVDYDWNLAQAQGRFFRRQIYSHQGQIDKFGRRPPLRLASKGIKTASGGQAILDDRALQVIKRWGEPGLVLDLDCLYRNHHLEAGDLITLTHPEIPNPKTGARGLTDELMQIVSMTPLFQQGLARFTLLWVAGLPTLTAPTSGGATQIPTQLPPDTVAPATPTGLAVGVSSEVLVDGTFIGIADATWAASSESDLAHYIVRFRKQGAGAFQDVFSGKQPSPRQIIRGLSPSTTYEFQVAAVDFSGNASAFSASVLATTPADPGAPAVPTGLALTAFPLAVAVTWNLNPESDIAHYELQRADDAGFTANLIIRKIDGTAYVDKTSDTTTRFYKLRAVRRTNVASGFTASASAAGLKVGTPQVLDSAITALQIAADAVTSAKIQDLAVIAAKIAAGAVDQSKVIAGLRLVEIVSALPAAGTQGRTVFLTTDNKLYRDTGTAWTAVVPAADLTGQITETQITDLAISTPKLAANAVTAAKIAAGTITSSEIAADTIVAGNIAAGAITASELAALSVIAGKIAVDAVSATEIAAGAVVAAKIAAGAVIAGKIAAGAITAAGAEIADATVTTAKIADANITTAKIAALAVDTAKIGDLQVTTLKLADQNVTTAKIRDGAITKVSSFSNDAAVSLGENVWTEVASASFTEETSFPISVSGRVSVNGGANGGLAKVRLMKGAVVLAAIEPLFSVNPNESQIKALVDSNETIGGTFALQVFADRPGLTASVRRLSVDQARK